MQPDLRRIQRGSLAHGGEPLDLFRKARPDRPMRIVVLCDISGSIEACARVFLAFVKGLIDVDTTADAYMFRTRLIRVTGALRDYDSLRAAGRLPLMAQGSGDGTDIGAALPKDMAGHPETIRDSGTDLAALGLGPRDVVIVASQGIQDQASLRAALESPAERVSMIAWRRKATALCARLADAGLTTDRVARLKAPAGLDIGALDPHDIALSVLAKIITWRNAARTAKDLSHEKTA